MGACISLSANAYIPQDIPEYRQLLIKQGHHAPYNELTVQRVIVGKAQIMQNGAIINLPHGPKFVPSLDVLRNNTNVLRNNTKETWSVNSINLDVKVNEDNFHWTENERKWIDIFFWTTQILDVYSTYKGMKYDCLYEANPLLPEVPKIHEMVGLKLSIIGGTKFVVDADKNFWYGWKLGAGISTGVIVINNFRLINKAERRCDKR